MRRLTVFLAILLCLPAAAQEKAHVTNPLSGAKTGDWALYAWHLRSPMSTMLGTLRLELKDKVGGKFTLTEELGHGRIGKTVTHTAYTLARSFVEQVELIYGQTYSGLKITKATSKNGVEVVIGKRKYRCTEVKITFFATHKELPCRGDLIYYLKSERLGPLNMVKFVSTISFKAQGARDYGLTQEMTLLLSDWKGKPK